MEKVKHSVIEESENGLQKTFEEVQSLNFKRFQKFHSRITTSEIPINT